MFFFQQYLITWRITLASKAGTSDMRHNLPQEDCLSELSVLAAEKSACYCYIPIQSMLSSKTSEQTWRTDG